ELLRCFDEPAAADAFPKLVAKVHGDAAHVRLVQHTDLVFLHFRALPRATQAHVRRWVSEMVAGMRTFVLRYPTGIRIQSLEEYREYCYYVAGTVGYMLTDLWHEHSRTITAARHKLLRARCRAFAEALQTVNILKDVARDAKQENSIYIPEELLREHGASHATLLRAERAGEVRGALTTLGRLATRDLDHATAYLLMLPRRSVAIRLFCALPLLFACATLRDLRRAWRTPETSGAVVKISRREVKTLTILGVLGIGSNRMLAWLAQRTAR